MKAYEVIGSPEKWTKGATARTEQGEMINPHNPSAHSWCAEGAIAVAHPGTDEFDFRNFIKDFEKLRACVGTSVARWNDNSTWETVYQTLKELEI